MNNSAPLKSKHWPACFLRVICGMMLILGGCKNLLLAQTLPPISWDKAFGGSKLDAPKRIIPTADGGFLIGGESWSGISGMKSENPRGFRDYWVVKTDANGTLIWEKTLGSADGDNFGDMVQTSDGGYLIGGSSGSRISGEKTETYRGGLDYWIVKVDAQGNKLWDKTYGGDNHDYLTTVLQTADGGFILGGSSTSGAGFEKSQASKGRQDIWIIKTDGRGKKLWDRTFGGNNDEQLSDIKVTSDGGFIVAGWSNSEANGDKTSPSRGSSDFWILKLDAIGNLQWDKTYGGSGSEGLIDLLQLPDGNLVIGGFSISPVSGDKTNAIRDYFYQHYWLLKLDRNGNKIWDKSIDNAPAFNYRLKPTSDNGFLLGCTVDSESTLSRHLPGKGAYDFWLIKLDATGNQVWDKVIGSSNGDVLHDLLQTSDGGFLLAGAAQTGASADKTHPGFGENDFWLVKLGAEPAIDNPGPIRPNFESDCAGTSINFTSSFTAAADSVSWNFGDPQSGSLNLSQAISPRHIFSQPGKYEVTLTVFVAGIPASYSQEIIIKESPLADLGPDRSFCAGTELQLRNKFNHPGQTYLWSTGDTTRTLTVTKPGNYTLRVGNGSCFAAASVKVEAAFCPENFLIPNIITPNNDGKNDKLVIQGLLPGSASLMVYNRWGSLIFQSNAYQNDWPTQSLSDGTYFYFLSIPEFNKTAKGWLEVIR